MKDSMVQNQVTLQQLSYIIQNLENLHTKHGYILTKLNVAKELLCVSNLNTVAELIQSKLQNLTKQNTNAETSPRLSLTRIWLNLPVIPKTKLALPDFFLGILQLKADPEVKVKHDNIVKEAQELSNMIYYKLAKEAFDNAQSESENKPPNAQAPRHHHHQHRQNQHHYHTHQNSKIGGRPFSSRNVHHMHSNQISRM